MAALDQGLLPLEETFEAVLDLDLSALAAISSNLAPFVA